MVGQFANVYYPAVTFWGNAIAIHKWYWPHPVYVFFNGCTGTMVDAFLIYRLHRVWKKMWFTLFLGCCVFLGFVCSIIVSIIGIIMLSDDHKSLRERTATGALLLTVGTAGADIFIAAARIWKLCTAKSPSHVTNSLIHRLIIGALQTGSTTSTVAVAMLISYYIDEDGGNVPTAFSYLIGPLYVLTLLYNLNLGPCDDFAASTAGIRTGLSLTNPTLTVDFYTDGSHVHRTATVSIDDPPTRTRSRSGISRSFIGFRQNNDSGPYRTPHYIRQVKSEQ
ncbi:hypothetical protein K438DRAFT_1840176 [Mycena galopus ATCC 62051]|nr:hypothetical protein K438DRAFT_1840176 [Mycena galopus ATCC 62051]